MRLTLNIIWLVFGGLWLALGYPVAALVSFALANLKRISVSPMPLVEDILPVDSLAEPAAHPWRAAA
ncbi:hypothetical protein AU193_19455 [Mycobacterium sp. GA-1285]|nr:hypothetical protein AU193_19455 [Mycobacterium sp. GA-1285]